MVQGDGWHGSSYAHFPTLCINYMYLPEGLIGSLDYLCPL